MPRKKKSELLRERIETAYWESRLLRGVIPKSVYGLCKECEIEEADFYKHFPSLTAIESRYWQSTVEETLSVLKADEDYASYDFQQKLLAFFYTYTAHIQTHRSRFVECFPEASLKGLKATQGMRKVFCQYAHELLQQGMEEGLVANRSKLNQVYDEALCLQFGAIIHYYRKDESENFQDTDAFIEKTVRLAMDGLKSGFLESVFDLARFMMRGVKGKE